MAKETKLYDDKTRKAKIKAAKKKLLDLYPNLSGATRITLDSLADNLAWMQVQLEELRELIARDGVVEIYNMGHMEATKKSASTQAFVSIQGAYLRSLRQFSDYVKKTAGDEGAGDLLEFLKRGRG